MIFTQASDAMDVFSKMHFVWLQFVSLLPMYFIGSARRKLTSYVYGLLFVIARTIGAVVPQTGS